MPDNMKPIIAKYFADTLKNDLGDELSRNIVANLPPDVNFVSETQDPTAIHMMDQMKAAMDMNMEELTKLKQENDELRQQLFQAQVSMLDGREQRQYDFAKFQINEQDKMMLESAKLGLQEQKNETDAIMNEHELAVKAAEVDIKNKEKVTDQVLESYKLDLEATKEDNRAVESILKGPYNG